MTLVRTLDSIEPFLHHVTQEGNSYIIDDVDPFISFDTPDLHLSGKDAGILRIEFEYVGETTSPRIQAYF